MGVVARFEVPVDELTGDRLDSISRGIPDIANVVITKEQKEVETKYSTEIVDIVVFTATY